MKRASDIEFTKMTGTGNDFLFIDARDKNFPQLDRPEFVKAVCNRTFGVGADGVAFVKESTEGGISVEWDFYNSDGSFAEMCGNASRCLGRWAFDKKMVDKKFKFKTLAGVIEAEVVSSRSVAVTMTKPVLVEENLQIALEGDVFKISFWNTGVPHAVLEANSWDNENLRNVGEFLRNHPHFKKSRGTNVTFFEKLAENKIQSASFERGVEDITLACGTGAVAAAAHGFKFEGVQSPVEVNVPGGVLQVRLSKNLDQAILSGEVQYIAEGLLSSEIYTHE